MFDYLTWALCSFVGGKKQTRYLNNQALMNIYYNLMNVSLSMFEYEGLPDTCNARYLEMALITGLACIVDDKERGLLSLRANVADGLNIYGEIPKIHATGLDGYNKEFIAYMRGSDNTKANAVVCRDNPMGYPYINYILRASERLMSAERSIDVASKKLKNPYFITCEESQYASVKKVLNDIDNNEESIIANKSTMPDQFKVFPTHTDSSNLNTLWQHYNNLDNQIRCLLGIPNNASQEKKERLIVDEVNMSQYITGMNLDMRLRQREMFCEDCNELFGINMSVRVNENIRRCKDATLVETDTEIHNAE